ncbi:MAG: hypothetical protein ACJAZO_003105 [Myxococcota bacterium]|jgi:hypothetical protein
MSHSQVIHTKVSATFVPCLAIVDRRLRCVDREQLRPSGAGHCAVERRDVVILGHRYPACHLAAQRGPALD